MSDTTTPRMTLSRVIEMLLERGQSDRSSVSLSRNAKGETQIEVVVRTSDEGAVQTVEQAEAVAQLVYDRLRAAYPMANGHVGAIPAASPPAAPAPVGTDGGS